MTATVITGPEISRMQLIVVTGAMRMYINHGIKASRMYTPANMMAFASSITGKTYKRNALAEAYNDLREAFPEIVRPLKEKAQ